MATLIADTACIDPRAELADDVEVGPYCVIGPDVKIGRGTRLIAHVCIQGVTTLGEGNVVHPVRGHRRRSPGRLVPRQPRPASRSATRTCIREGVTIHRGSEKEQGLTRIGSNNLLMVNVHVAHDCVLDDRIMIANNTILGGHCHVESLRDHLGRSGHPSVRDDRILQLRRGLVADLPRRAAVHDRRRQPLARSAASTSSGSSATGSAPRPSSALHEAHRLIYRRR